MCRNGQYPGLFLFSTPARMMRPVVNLSTKSEELIGSFEQVLPIRFDASCITMLSHTHTHTHTHRYI